MGESRRQLTPAVSVALQVVWPQGEWEQSARSVSFPRQTTFPNQNPSVAFPKAFAPMIARAFAGL